MDTTGLLLDWLSNPIPIVVTLVGVALAAFLYWRGARYARRTGIGRPVETLQALAFAGGLLALAVAIASPFDTLADRSLAAHMAQHALIILVAAPLLLLGEPFWRIWRALPTGWRRESLRWLMRRGRLCQAWGALEAVARRPVALLLLFLSVYLLWHIPALYDLALRHEAIHAVEHVSFLLVALLFWAQVIPIFPLRPRLSYAQRAGYVFVAGLALHLFAILIAIARQPIYAYYGSGPAASADQDAAAAMMDVSGMFVFTITLMVLLGLWLRDDDKADAIALDTASVTSVTEPSAGGALLLLEADVIGIAPTDTPPPRGLS
jgi:putative membrane protein